MVELSNKVFPEYLSNIYNPGEEPLKTSRALQEKLLMAVYGPGQLATVGRVL